MSDLSQQRRRSTGAEGNGVTASFCGHCSRVLYVAEADLLFCPVCSSLVTRIESETATESHEGTPASH